METEGSLSCLQEPATGPCFSVITNMHTNLHCFLTFSIKNSILQELHEFVWLKCQNFSALTKKF